MYRVKVRHCQVESRVRKYMNKPKIFVSSTIYDFKDLRSALKYWLTEKGYEVRMSERNDFKKDSNQNSYQACLDSIKECDYFILLIGSRAGGIYSQNPLITITQKEYQYANELAQKGVIKKLLVFVRKSVWDIREDRRSLQKYIENELLKDEDLKSREEQLKLITKQSSSIVKDAEIIFDFIKEVTKVDEMKKAIQSSEDYPERNWINQFDNFEDIISVLKIELRAEYDVEIKRWNENLKQEISENLARLSTSSNHEIFPIFNFATLARRKLPEKFGQSYTLNSKEIVMLKAFATIGILQGELLSLDVITAAINAGVYLKYNNQIGKYNSGNIQKALLDMVLSIKGLKRQKQVFGENHIIDIINKLSQIPEGASLTLNSDDMLLFGVYAAYDYHYNIYQLSKYLLGIFEGIIKDDKYPFLYQEGVFKVFGDNDEPSIILPQEAYEACINKLKMEIKSDE